MSEQRLVLRAALIRCASLATMFPGSTDGALLALARCGNEQSYIIPAVGSLISAQLRLPMQARHTTAGNVPRRGAAETRRRELGGHKGYPVRRGPVHFSRYVLVTILAFCLTVLSDCRTNDCSYSPSDENSYGALASTEAHSVPLELEL